MKHNLLLSSLILSTLLASTGCMQTPSVMKEPSPSEIINTPATIDEAPQIEETSSSSAEKKISYHFKSIEGKNIDIIEESRGFTFPQYKDKIVLLEIFGKECEYCMDELPLISKLRQKYGDNLQVISIQAEEPMTKAEYLTLKENFNMDYPIIERNVAIELLYSLRDTFGWSTVLPYVQIIKDGVTQYHFPGQTSEQELNEAMLDLAGY